MKPRLLFVSLVITSCCAVPLCAQDTDAPSVETYLVEGKLELGERELTRYLELHPDDQEVRFGLGTLQFLMSIEHLGQSLNKYGAIGSESRLARNIPLLRLNVPKSQQPNTADYDDIREVLQRFVDDLAKAQETLAPIDDPLLKMPLHFGMIRLDLDGDGVGSDEETLWRVYADLNRGLRLGADFEPAEAKRFVISFDLGDVYWLRGYCHLLSGMCESVLAYDESKLFDAIGHQLFARPRTATLRHPAFEKKQWPWEEDIADVIAAIHRMSFPLVEPEKMKAALGHFQEVISLSRLSWQAIQAEDDDDAEWVPNAKQTGVIPGVRVTAEMIEGWHGFLDEADKMLAGDKLIPHWRFTEGYGINLKRVFEEPREFDLVMWVHGESALPYTEKGATTDMATWNRLERIFGGQFIGFAFWFN